MGEEKDKSLFSDHKTIGWIISLIVHILLMLFIFYLPHFVKDEQEAAYEGVLVSFGLPIESVSADEASQSAPIEEEADLPEMEEVKPNEAREELEATLTEEDSPGLVSTPDEKKEVERKPSRAEPVEEIPEENNLDKAKDAFSQLFNRSANSGTTPAQSGDPLGEPDATILEGISKGKGKVGGGLDERGVLQEPEIFEHSQKSGRVVVNVCVDSTGAVISSKFTQRGSTTTDRELVEIAEISARKYRFTPSSFAKQCGTISINFIVQ